MLKEEKIVAGQVNASTETHIEPEQDGRSPNGAWSDVLALSARVDASANTSGASSALGPAALNHAALLHAHEELDGYLRKHRREASLASHIERVDADGRLATVHAWLQRFAPVSDGVSSENDAAAAGIEGRRPLSTPHSVRLSTVLDRSRDTRIYYAADAGLNEGAFFSNNIGTASEIRPGFSPIVLVNWAQRILSNPLVQTCFPEVGVQLATKLGTGIGKTLDPEWVRRVEATSPWFEAWEREGRPVHSLLRDLQSAGPGAALSLAPETKPALMVYKDGLFLLRSSRLGLPDAVALAVLVLRDELTKEIKVSAYLPWLPELFNEHGQIRRELAWNGPRPRQWQIEDHSDVAVPAELQAAEPQAEELQAEEPLALGSHGPTQVSEINLDEAQTDPSSSADVRPAVVGEGPTELVMQTNYEPAPTTGNPVSTDSQALAEASTDSATDHQAETPAVAELLEDNTLVEDRGNGFVRDKIILPNGGGPLASRLPRHKPLVTGDDASVSSVVGHVLKGESATQPEAVPSSTDDTVSWAGSSDALDLASSVARLERLKESILREYELKRSKKAVSRNLGIDRKLVQRVVDHPEEPIEQSIAATSWRKGEELKAPRLPAGVLEASAEANITTESELQPELTADPVSVAIERLAASGRVTDERIAAALEPVLSVLSSQEASPTVLQEATVLEDQADIFVDRLARIATRVREINEKRMRLQVGESDLERSRRTVAEELGRYASELADRVGNVVGNRR